VQPRNVMLVHGDPLKTSVLKQRVEWDYGARPACPRARPRASPRRPAHAKVLAVLAVPGVPCFNPHNLSRTVIGNGQPSVPILVSLNVLPSHCRSTAEFEWDSDGDTGAEARPDGQEAGLQRGKPSKTELKADDGAEVGGVSLRLPQGFSFRDADAWGMSQSQGGSQSRSVMQSAPPGCRGREPAKTVLLSTQEVRLTSPAAACP